MKKLLLFACMLCSGVAQSTTFTYNTPSLIPDNNLTTIYPVTVSGLPTAINSSYGLSQVTLDITHPNAGDMIISLRSPSNTITILSLHNGVGANYTATVLRMDAATRIFDGLAPFNGDYLPSQSINFLNDGNDPNGVWQLEILDEFPTNQGVLNTFSLEFTSNPPADPLILSACSTTDASLCQCQTSGQTDCDLLPDLINSALTVANGWNEVTGTIDLPNTIVNIGYGPLEMVPTGTCLCDTTVVNCSVTMCPDGSSPKQRVNQRIFHKNPNGQMTNYLAPAGSQALHTTHNHVHAEDFAFFSLRVANTDPDPLKWPVVGSVLKQGYCLVNMGTCNSQTNLCISHGVVITDAMIPNLGLGSLTGCGAGGQGLYVGRYDTYSSGFGQIIQAPGICDGNYELVVEVDPYNNFQEIDETNNVISVPVTLTQQAGAPLDATFTYAVSNYDVLFIPNDPNLTCTWTVNDGFSTTDQYAYHYFTTPGIYMVTLTVSNGTCSSTSSQYINVGSVGINDNYSGLANITVFPNPSTEDFTLNYTLANPVNVAIDVVDITGKMIQNISSGKQIAGLHKVDIKDLSTGVYFVRIKADDRMEIKRIVKM